MDNATINSEGTESTLTLFLTTQIYRQNAFETRQRIQTENWVTGREQAEAFDVFAQRAFPNFDRRYQHFLSISIDY